MLGDAEFEWRDEFGWINQPETTETGNNMFLPLFYANMIKAFKTEVKIIQYHGISDSGSKPIHVSLNTVLARLLIVGSCGRVQLCESRMTGKRSTNYAEPFLFCYYENGIRVLLKKTRCVSYFSQLQKRPSPHQKKHLVHFVDHLFHVVPARPPVE